MRKRLCYIDKLLSQENGSKTQNKTKKTLSASVDLSMLTNFCIFIKLSDFLSAVFQCLSPGHQLKQVAQCLLPCETLSSLTQCWHSLSIINFQWVILNLHVHRCGQSFALVGDQAFMYGGYGTGGDLCKDLHVLNTGKTHFQFIFGVFIYATTVLVFQCNNTTKQTRFRRQYIGKINMVWEVISR